MDSIPPFVSLEMTRNAAVTLPWSIRLLNILAVFCRFSAWLVGGGRCL